MIQTRRNKIYSIDARLYLSFEQYYPFLLDELKGILDEEISEFNSMSEGLKDSDRGKESRQAQEYLEKAIKGLKKIVDGKKKQELMDIVHENLRAV